MPSAKSRFDAFKNTNRFLLGCASLLVAAFFSTLSASGAAATNYVVTVSVVPKTAGTVTGPEGTAVSGPVTNETGIPSTFTAEATNDCYEFTSWEVGGKKVTSNPITLTNKETLVANFTLLEYTNGTSSLPANGGTSSGGGKKGCGTYNTITARASTGFKFLYWTSTASGNFQYSDNPLKYTVTGDYDFVAHFEYVQPPVATIIAPTSGEKIAKAGLEIYGPTSASTSHVYYVLNDSAPALATISEEFPIVGGKKITNVVWFAEVTLAPNNLNTLEVYGESTNGIYSKATNKVLFACTAAGLAPLSLAGEYGTLPPSSTVDLTNFICFDSAAFVADANTNNVGEVGTYTYTPTGPNTAQLVSEVALPMPEAAITYDLTFTNAYNATYTNSFGDTGLLALALVETNVPATLDGSNMVTRSYNTNDAATALYSFGSATFTTNGATGELSSYIYTRITAGAALLVASNMDGTANYTLLAFTNDLQAPPGGTYRMTTFGSGPQFPLVDVGSFGIGVGTGLDKTKYVGPATLAGLQVTVVPEENAALTFTRSFGNGTFASIFVPPATNKSLSLITNKPNDVGILLANTRVNATHGFLSYMALQPPYAVGQDEETVDIYWKSATSAIATNTATGEVNKLTFSTAPHYAPAALSGHKITVPQTGNPSTATTTFTYNLFSDTQSNSGTYTYAPYTPTMALVQLNTTNGPNAGLVQYIVVEYKSAAAGEYVRFKENSGFKTGTFTMK